MHEFLHTFLHTLEHTASSLPFLFAAYLLIEFIEHRHSEKFAAWLGKFGKAGAFIGAILGVVPQCGFSVVAANLYSNRIITAGTMLAVFISTSDEAIPVLLSNPESAGKILPLICSKLLLAIVAGLLVDRFGLFNITKEELEEVAEEHSHCHTEGHNGLLKSTLTHTAKTFAFIFIVMFALELCIETLGEEAFASFIASESLLQPLVAGIVGLIPNCASSIIIAQLYAEGAISFGAAFAGLSVGAGTGLLVLFRNDVDKIECLSLTGFLFAVSVLTGTVLQFII
ncbi:MAG: arsenic efflux protein [Oscillospiraceae bacterium]|nr:arsenic efflux protein [Oscillospiraceae bacterium]MBQ4643606.1 arsenic efflux protein [Oscillospiraceae bacterium]